MYCTLSRDGALHNDPQRPWQKFEKLMSGDYVFLCSQLNNTKSKVLENINCILESMRKTIDNYDLVDQNVCLNTEENTLKEINEEFEIVVDEEDIVAIKSLNCEQKKCI